MAGRVESIGAKRGILGGCATVAMAAALVGLGVTVGSASASAKTRGLDNIAATVLFGSSSVDFGKADIKSGQPLPAQTVNVTNTSDRDIAIKRWIVQGQNPKVFGATDDCEKRIPAGGTCTFTVRFKPVTTGS